MVSSRAHAFVLTTCLQLSLNLVPATDIVFRIGSKIVDLAST